MKTKYITRLLANNEQLAKEMKSYIQGRDKLTIDVWRTKLKPIMRDTQNRINQYLKSLDATDWQTYNLTRINESIQVVINDFNTRFTNEIIAAQNQSADIAISITEKNANLVGLKSPAESLLGTELIETLLPATRQFLEYWSANFARIIGTQITSGIIEGKTPFQVASDINKVFGYDEQTIATLQNKKDILKKQLDKGTISKTTYKKKVRPINKKLDAGSMVSYARAEMIARTEMLTASSMAQYRTGLRVGKINPQARKVWLWSHKPTGRRSHAIAEDKYREKPIKVDAPFIVDGEPGQFPRSPEFSAGNRVNCGCTMVLINGADLSQLELLGG